ncbi:hypothetical protein GQ42DRAFT_179073 [Ramicandelaber brevisporus]|nr:hypothetical protein GQ42DRAFT_179073 [Ramicandelaber brevisporus]
MRFFVQLFTLLVAFGACLARASFTYTNCHPPSGDVATIQSFVISPDPPEGGKDAEITVTATSDRTITGGVIKAVASLWFISSSESWDICKVAAESGSPCPLAPGTHTLKLTQSIAKLASGFTVNLKVTGTTTTNKEIFCITGWRVSWVESSPRVSFAFPSFICLL